MTYDMDKAQISGYSGPGQVKTVVYRLPGYTYLYTSYKTFVSYPWTQDRIQYVKKSPLRGPKPCLHEQVLGSGSANPSWAEVGGGLYKEIFVTNAAACAGVFPTARHLSPYVDTDSLLRGLADDIGGRIQPGLLSLATIGEVGSLKGLAESLSGWVGTLRAILSGSVSISNLAKAHLGWKFGVKPLLSDLQASVNVMANIRAHLLKLRRRNRISWQDFSVSKSSTDSQTSAGGYKTTTKRTVRYTCQACCSYTLDNADTIRDVLAYFGLDRPFSTVWELVPFSFILDYVLRIQNVARALDDIMSSPSHNAVVQIRHIQRTEKLETTTYTEYAYGLYQGAVPVICKKYTRTVDVDLAGSEAFLEGLALHGMSLRAALTTGEVIAAGGGFRLGRAG